MIRPVFASLEKRLDPQMAHRGFFFFIPGAQELLLQVAVNVKGCFKF